MEQIKSIKTQQYVNSWNFHKSFENSQEPFLEFLIHEFMLFMLKNNNQPIEMEETKEWNQKRNFCKITQEH